MRNTCLTLLCSDYSREAVWSFKPNSNSLHYTCSFLDSKDEVQETITLPELTKRLLEAKQKLAEFPDSLKVSFQKR